MFKPLAVAAFIGFAAQPLIAAEPAPVDRVYESGNIDSALTQSVETPQPVTLLQPKRRQHAIAKPEDDSQAPLLETVSDSDYTVQPGDVLQITVWKEDALDREILVLPDGTINYPLIGAFTVKNMTPAYMQALVKYKLRHLIPDASVTVMVKAPLGHSVNIIGQVAKPGEFIMSHRLTVMQALSQAGGLTPYASQSHIIILRTQDGRETAIAFPYTDIIAGKSLDKDIALNPGDVVVVPSASLF